MYSYFCGTTYSKPVVMKAWAYIVCSFIIMSLCFSIAFGLTPNSKWRILENFKLQEQEMIFESDTLLDDSDKNVLSTYRKLWIYKNIAEKAKEKREYLEEQTEKITSRVNSLEDAVQEFDDDIEDLLEEINRINQEVIELKKKIEINKDKIAILQKKIAENNAVLLDYMVYLYKKWEYVSSDNDIDNLKTILLSGEKIDELVNDLYFKSIMQVTWQSLVQKHRDFVSKLYVQKLELQKTEKDLKAVRKAGIIEKNTLDDKRAAKQRLLDITKGQEELFKKYIEDQIEIERDIKVKELTEQIALNNTKKKLLEKHGCDFVDIWGAWDSQASLSDKCTDINKIIYAESRITKTVVENNPLDWPVSPARGISAYFKDEGYIRELGTDHDALDIRVAQWTDIKAPMDGYVIFLQPPVNTGYAYVALKHSDGLVTIYGHINKSFVGKYDFVKKWEVFATTWGLYGTKWAWVLSTWPHLHFVVYEDQQYRDPLDYLDISYLDYSDLSVQYQYKYQSDFRSRKGTEYEDKKVDGGTWVFKIIWDNEVERQRYLLDTYAVGDFRNWDLWVEESIAAKVDPTFVMCVGLAETTLGKYLKTPYNIGNVWNTDSGATITFPNARSGIHSMVKAFNNRYLSQYDEIRLLSRYGNSDSSKPIYASSSFNWHNNITKCMSHVKWVYVPDDFNFRITD